MSAAVRPGRLVVVSGPSGVGKDTVLRALFALNPELRYSVSYTTRAPRPGEVDGTSYSFVDEPAFLAMVERGEFLEWARVHGNLYGTSLARVRECLARGEDVVLKIDVQGAAQLRGRVPEAIFIFLLPPSAEALRQRLQARDTEDEESLAVREADAQRELAEAERYDHQVVNDQVERAAGEILDIVAASRGENVGRA
ncbi:MAG TPA: guanylate kinase [Candidatus Angelobacter sp.]|nr:guanylate kinase [Candidatus Angelobacter sp.]